MLLSISLPKMLVICYLIAFGLALFVPADFLSVAFDSGGVTTGPMTVPFIMALGIGISAIRSDKHASDDSFGLVALCSVGPIIAVLILGLIYHPDSMDYVPQAIPKIQDSVALWHMFATEIPEYMKEMAVSLLPIVVFFGIFQLFARDIKKKTLIKIGIGLVYTYVGLVLFLTGVNVGFMPAGNYLGQVIAGLPYRFIIVPIGMIIGYFIVQAEPAVFVLTNFGRSHGNQSFCWCVSFHRPRNDPGTDRDFYYVVSHSRLCRSIDTDLFCTEDLYSDCF